ncbi:MAG: hypothetical protein ABUK01_11845 [Leptospirales bacterium]
MNSKNISSQGILEACCTVEIRLQREIWNRLRMVTQKRDTGYCDVVREALFRLIKRKNPEVYVNNKPVKSSSVTRERDPYEKTHAKASENMHRFKLCLFGEDKLQLKLVALKMRCSMSYLVRIALEKELAEL